MNNKEIYNKLVKILNKQDSDYMKTLEEIKKELEAEIITGGKINNGIKQAFKRLQKENEIRTKFQNVLRNGNDTYSITNGYFMVTYNGQNLPDELKPYINPNEKEIDEGLQFDRLKNSGDLGYELSYVSINYDNLLKIYKYNKVNKKRNFYTMHNGFTFNIQYLLDILALLKEKDLSNVKLEISEHTHHPMNIYSDNGKGILLPIRMETEEIEEQLRLQEKIIKGE